jgi:hypothetical protein
MYLLLDVFAMFAFCNCEPPSQIQPELWTVAEKAAKPQGRVNRL